MNLLDFDPSLSDSAKLASIARSAKAAMDYAEGALSRAEAFSTDDLATTWACRAGYLEAAVEVLCAYLGQIAGHVKPDVLVPGLDDLAEVPDEAA